MLPVFWIAAIVAIVSTVMVITRANAIHALLYLIVSLLAVAVMFMVLGAPFVAMLEIIVYAGAIMVLFVFVIMLLNLGPKGVEQERRWLKGGVWGGPCVLTFILLVEVGVMLSRSGIAESPAIVPVPPKEVGIALFGPYLIGVQLAGILLLGGLVAAYHIGRPEPRDEEKPT
ncbi:MAG TPA: NADH-quinone oxidoreductase subunit J [Planctomycetes bacterium]|nr:NADH-quinone oxidoreductase subunit J [Planctomycetota bacterium]